MTKTRAFCIVFAVADVGLILYGMLALTMPGILLDSFSNHVYQFSPNDSVAMAYLSALYRLLGFLNLLLGAIGLFLLWRYRIHRQAWLVYAVIAFSFLSYLGPIVFDNTVGNIGFFEIIEHIFFIAMILAGIVILVDRRFHESP